MENKTGIKDAIKALWEIPVVFFSKQKNNQMFTDLKIVKGVSAGVGYLIYLGFVLPSKIIAFMLNPSWEWVHFTQRHLVSPIFEVEALTGSESPSRLLGEIYEKNLNYFKTTKDSGVKSSTLKPSISILERIMIFAKVRVIITLFYFAMGAVAFYEVFGALIDLIGLLAAVIGGAITVGGMGGNAGIGFVGASITGIFSYLLWVLLGTLTAYMLMFAVRFLVQSVKSIMYADRQMLKDFVDDSLHYTITKSIELYGEEVALKAYDLLLENVVINIERYTTKEPHYKKLEHKKTLKIDDSSKE